MRHLFLFTLIVFILISCNRNGGYVINGHVTGFPDSTVVYLQNLSSDETFDSAYIINNRFQLKGVLESVPEQLWLHAMVDNQFVYTNLLMGNENITVTGDVSDFPDDVMIKGSKIQQDYDYIRDELKPLNKERNTLLEKYFALPLDAQKEQHQDIWGRISVIDRLNDSLTQSFVKTHINTYAGVIYLGYQKKNFPRDTVQFLYNQLTGEVKDSKYAKTIEIYLSEKISEVGDKYHDFEAINKQDEPVRFSDLMSDGKYKLLYFTSAHCGPCKMAVEELRGIHNNYNDSLQIVCFSGDANKETWLKTLERDKATWISLWDGKGKYSETYIKYGVTGFPTFFVIDPNGIIINKFSGYGPGHLESKLAQFKNEETS